MNLIENSKNDVTEKDSIIYNIVEEEKIVFDTIFKLETIRDTIYITDTVYKIDTIIYKKEDIKRIKFRN